MRDAHANLPLALVSSVWQIRVVDEQAPDTERDPKQWQLQQLRRAVEDVAKRLDALESAYPVVAGLTPAQRAGATAGLTGALIALATALPHVIEILKGNR